MRNSVAFIQHGTPFVDLISILDEREYREDFLKSIVTSDNSETDLQLDSLRGLTQEQQVEKSLQLSIQKLNSSLDDVVIASAAHELQHSFDPVFSESVGIISNEFKARVAELANKPSEALFNAIGTALKFRSKLCTLEYPGMISGFIPNLLIFHRLVDEINKNPDEFGVVIDRESELTPTVQIYGQLHKLANLDENLLAKKLASYCSSPSSATLGYALGSKLEVRNNLDPANKVL